VPYTPVLPVGPGSLSVGAQHAAPHVRTISNFSLFGPLTGSFLPRQGPAVLGPYEEMQSPPPVAPLFLLMYIQKLHELQFTSCQPPPRGR
jgi:hypothetical protein